MRAAVNLDSRVLSDDEDAPSMDASGVPWVQLEYEKSVVGRRLEDVLLEWHREDWARVGPLLEEAVTKNFGNQMDDILELQQPIGDVEDCLRIVPELFLAYFDQSSIRNQVLWSFPAALSEWDVNRVVERVVRHTRFNPGRRDLDETQDSYEQLVNIVKQEMNTLRDWSVSLIAAQRDFVEADLESLDAYHQPNVGRVFLGPIYGICHPDARSDGKDFSFFTELTAMGTSNYEECGLLNAVYSIDWHHVPAIAAEIQSVLDYKLDIEVRLREQIALIPSS